MLRDIYLHGAPGRAHGRRWRLDVASPAEAVRALTVLKPALRDVFRKGYWRVIVGPPHIRNGVRAEHLRMNMGKQPLHIVPATVPRGSDIGDIAAIVVGAILIGVAIVATGGLGAAFATPLIGTAASGLTFGTLVTLGVGLVATGVMGLLTPNLATQEAPTEQAAPDDRPSFFFNGVVNNTQQGGPVPLVFGTHLVGSVVISGALQAVDIWS
jgi:predicted phage tail protein